MLGIDIDSTQALPERGSQPGVGGIWSGEQTGKQAIIIQWDRSPPLRGGPDGVAQRAST